MTDFLPRRMSVVARTGRSEQASSDEETEMSRYVWLCRANSLFLEELNSSVALVE